jgi:hypothetical protein
MKYGDPVLYEGKDGETELAFVIGGDRVKADLQLASGGKLKEVPRRAEGGGHTYRDGKL